MAIGSERFRLWCTLLVLALVGAAGLSCVDGQSGGLGIIAPDAEPVDVEELVVGVEVDTVAGVRSQLAVPVTTDEGGPRLSSETAEVIATAGGRSSLALTGDDDITRLFVGIDGPSIDALGSFAIDLTTRRAARQLAVELDWGLTIDTVPGPFELRFQAIDAEGRGGPLFTRPLTAVSCGGPDDPCPAVCGNGRIEDGEACDGDALGGADCTSAGFDGGVLACDASCRLDTAACVACGDGLRNGDEQCDGQDLGGATCESAGFGEGTLSCDSSCQFDASACESCGNGVVDGPGEACDGNDLRGTTCADQGFDGGVLSCTDGCAFDLGACFVCGDGERNGQEECDGVDLGGATCAGEGFGGGTLTCDGACRFDTSGCTECGDGVREGSEPCDGSDLGGATCVSQGFGGGPLSCSGSCELDTSACYVCGDGTRDPGEACDGNDLGDAECEDAGFDGGTLACDDECELDTSACFGCGDGTRDGDEICDGDDLDGATCQSEGFVGGTLACDDECELDTGGCSECGDGGVDPGEDCDGSDLDGTDCDDLGFDGGTLACDASCGFDTSACFGCGDGTLDPGESCDGDELGGATCASEGFSGGTLGCSSACELDTSLCTAPCDVTLEFANPIGADLNPAPGQIFVSSIEVPLRLNSPDTAFVDVTFELSTTQVGVELQGCTTPLSGFVCEATDLEGIDPIARFRVYAPDGGSFGPTNGAPVVARPRFRLEFPVATSTVLVPIIPEAIVVTADDGATCDVVEATSGSIRVTDQ